MIISYFIEMIGRDDVYKGAYQACCISFVVERNYFPKTSFFMASLCYTVVEINK